MAISFAESTLHVKLRGKWRKKKMVYWKMVRCKITAHELAGPPGCIRLKLSVSLGEPE